MRKDHFESKQTVLPPLETGQNQCVDPPALFGVLLKVPDTMSPKLDDKVPPDLWWLLDQKRQKNK